MKIAEENDDLCILDEVAYMHVMVLLTIYWKDAFKG